MTTDAAFWNNRAEEYAAKPVELPDAFERKIAITRAHLRPHHVVLDVGCGTGSLALRLADAAGQVHGLDFSREMIRIARGKAQGVDNVQFHVGAFDGDLPFAEGSLDGLCAYSVLHLLHHREPALERIFRLVKPGGFFISSTVCVGDTWVPWGPMLALMQWIGKAPTVRVIKRQTLEAEVRAAGFVDLQWPDVGAKPTTAFLVAKRP